MRPEINFMIHDWMFKKLMLSGPRLLVLAYLFAARQNVKDRFRKVSEVSKSLPMCRRTALNSINSLEKKGFIKYKTVYENYVDVKYYTFNEDKVFNIVFKT